MASDASHVLEAALEQMDEIIAGSQAAERRPLLAPQLAEQHRLAVETQVGVEEKDAVDAQVAGPAVQTLLRWLEMGAGNVQSPVSNEGYQERLSRLEGDKESLVLQVSVLTDQVEAQGEKIRDLESNLEEHQHKLDSTEEMLQQELLRRTSLETQKLDLMDEVSYLKLKLVGMEEQQQGNKEDKQQKAECVVNLISELQEQMCKFQQEISTRIQEKQALEGQAGRSAEGPHAWSAQGPCSAPAEDPSQNKGENGLLQELRHLKSKVDELEGEKCQYERKLKSTKAEISNLEQLLAAKDAEIEGLQKQLVSRVPASDDNAERDQELQRLRIGMEALLAANEEKDRRIQELSSLLEQYRKIKDDTGLAQANEKRPGGSEEDLSRSGGLRGLTHRASVEILRQEVASRGSSPLAASPSSFDSRSTQVSPGSAVSHGNTSCPNGQWAKTRMLSSSLEELQCGPVQLVAGEPVDCVSPEIRHPEGGKFQTLPGKRWLAAQNGSRETPSPAAQRDDGDLILRKTEARASPDVSASSSGVDSGQNSPVSPEHRKNQKGIKKFWGKIRRTQSGSLQRDELEPSSFRRGGLRATAGPRLARTPDSGSSIRDKNTPFIKWTKEQVCGWLEDEGLGQYVSLTRQWVTSGQTLLAATPQDIEKEMGIKHPLHRKKIQLAVRSFSSKVPDKSAELDHIWVTRWLDDIGLPQYKDQFNEARVDGRMLQYLTLSDLLFLKVTSQLHHLSIKSAIHVLHINKFNPHCLRRRPGDESKMSPSEVIQWSNHRVMEWLRSVDLAEYAANLRGSGVHGGLLILEPRFNSDTLALLLNIPPQKTLLRRHLATNFTTLVGPQAQLEKRQCMGATGYTPLTTTAKVRPKKLGFSTFGHLRKKKLDDSTDYICPADMSPAAANGPVPPHAGLRGLSPIFDRDGERLEQAGRRS